MQEESRYWKIEVPMEKKILACPLGRRIQRNQTLWLQRKTKSPNVESAVEESAFESFAERGKNRRGTKAVSSLFWLVKCQGEKGLKKTINRQEQK